MKSDIRAAVIAKGFADASVVRQVVPDKMVNEYQIGEWFVLFVRDDAEWVCWGRRRTLPELLALAERGLLVIHRTPTRRFNEGLNRTYKVSRERVGTRYKRICAAENADACIAGNYRVESGNGEETN